MRLILILLIWIISFDAIAQVESASIQASGLTCSMCSNSIRKALQSADVVADVQANIKNSSFDIKFKSGVVVDFDLLKKKVEDAGFFVVKFTFKMHVSSLEFKQDQHLQLNQYKVHWLEKRDRAIQGLQEFRIVDKGFVTAKESKSLQANLSDKCYLSGTVAPCCKDWQHLPGGRVYHLTF